MEQQQIPVSAEEKGIEPQRVSPELEEKIIDVQEYPELATIDNLHEILPKQEEKVVDSQVFPEEREKVFDLQELLFESEKKEDLSGIGFKVGKGQKIINPQ